MPRTDNHHLFRDRKPLATWEEIREAGVWDEAYLPYEDETPRTTVVSASDDADVYRRLGEVT